ncbi:MAG: glycoside hydrolase family 2 protein, partial [Lachnospiraceae bacterium]|nr:glycoside hydrolase family 2 protein [Lachnospiraceae bacterium]
YVDGKLKEEKSGSHVFAFIVPMSGEHRIRAVAGECEDESVIRRVDRANPDYFLNKTRGSSANWV